MLSWAQKQGRAIGSASTRRISQVFVSPMAPGLLVGKLTSDETKKVRESSYFGFLFEKGRLNLYSRRAWIFCIWLIGILDLLASTIPSQISQNSWELAYLSPQGRKAVLSAAEGLIHFLRDNRVSICFAFSTVWFVDAFFDAWRKQFEAIIKNERKRLFSARHGHDRWGWTSNPMFVYWFTLILLLSCLPVGFFMGAKHILEHISKGELPESLDHVEPLSIELIGSNDFVFYTAEYGTRSNIANV